MQSSLEVPNTLGICSAESANSIGTGGYVVKLFYIEAANCNSSSF